MTQRVNCGLHTKVEFESSNSPLTVNSQKSIVLSEGATENMPGKTPKRPRKERTNVGEWTDAKKT